MNTDVTRVSDLSASERLQLAQDLWDSISDQAEAWMFSAQQMREVDRRLRAYQKRKTQGIDAGSSWSQVKRRVLKGK